MWKKHERKTQKTNTMEQPERAMQKSNIKDQHKKSMRGKTSFLRLETTNHKRFFNTINHHLNFSSNN
jgi:hypothetical protein